MMKRPLISAVALLGCAMLAFSSWLPAQAAGRRPSDLLDLAPQVAQVTQVIDGATIQVSMNGALYTVRYIGVDAPALNQCNGMQARNANAALVGGQTVRMEADAVDATADGTLLRYVYVLRGNMANEQMILNGYARAAIGTPNIKHQGDLNDMEQQARTRRSGGWSTCGWKSTVAKAPGACPTITAEALAARVDKVPEVGMLRAGDCVTILKAANPDGPEWSGQYTYYPAGTVLPLSKMYLRWKDGIVGLDVNSDGVPFAHVVLHTQTKYLRFGPFTFTREVPGPDRTTIQPVEQDPGRPEMLQIAMPRTWLLRDVGNGKYEVLIDAFVYKSGAMNDIAYGGNGYLQ
jgi:endonuclease YncB( thermonuclease family)